jgi:hypothetical protein
MITQDLCERLDLIQADIFYKRSPHNDNLDRLINWELSPDLDKAKIKKSSPSQLDSFYHLFTGERLVTIFAQMHIFHMECCRVLFLSAKEQDGLKEAIDSSIRSIEGTCFTNDCILGECAHASLAWMRCLAVGLVDDGIPRLEKRLDQLSGKRDGKGRWRGFPFYYTLLILSEIDHPMAREEIQYSSPSRERVREYAMKIGDYSARRKKLLDQLQN